MATIRYIATGRKSISVGISVSMNQGKSWQNKTLLPGQSFPIPPNATNILIDNVAYSPLQNMEIRDGRIAII